MKRILSILLFMLLITGNVRAIVPMDYQITYKNLFIEKGETIKTTTKIYCQESKKFRTESEIFVWSKIDGNVKTERPLSISIHRLDKRVVWLLDLKNKICREQPIIQQNLDGSPYLSMQYWKSKLTKIGEEKILKHNCDIYSYSGTIPRKIWISKDFDLVLKAESGVEGNKVVSEATKLSFSKQDDSLFEVPKDYRIITMIVTSPEEIEQQPMVTLAMIEKSLFADMKSLKLLVSKNAGFRGLSNEENAILRDSFLKGSNLGEISSEDLSAISQNQENPIFILEWSGKKMCNFWYDKSSGYIYVRKEHVFHEEIEKHEFDFNWLQKYAHGGYRFKPSQEIDKIIK